MKKRFLITFSLILLISFTAFAGNSELGSVDWFAILLVTIYVVAILILLPLVIYTNLNESVVDIPSDIGLKEGEVEGLTEEERNQKTDEILSALNDKLTPVEDEEGNELITITKGSQARFVKRGLDYILLKLKPSEEELINRVEEFRNVYENRAQRKFTGSKYIIISAVGLGALVWWAAGGFTTFIIIQALGLLFYILSSRTTMYGIENRVRWLGAVNLGFISGLFTSFFSAMDTEYYTVYSDGSKETDSEMTMTNWVFQIMLILFTAIILGFLVAVMGVVNFIMNYSRSFLWPFKKLDKWYEDNFTLDLTSDMVAAETEE